MDILEGVDREKFREYLGHGDGHTIFDPSYFTDMGFGEKFIAEVTEEYESDGTGKGSIYKDGKVLDRVKGVYSLTFLRRIVAELALESGGGIMLGRGSEARCHAKAIAKYLDEQK